MPITEEQQCQQWSDEVTRPLCEATRSLLAAYDDWHNRFGDLYAYLNGTPTWEDNRTDGPPHAVLASDLLAINTFVENMRTAISGDAQLPIVLKVCARTP